MMHKLSLVEKEENIAVIRKFAKSKDLSLQKVRNQDLWNIKDTQTGRMVVERALLQEAYEVIQGYDF